ncbi:MAG: WG repeat-containing protein [Bacteroidaceae bacterium]|nr:WG repeat-containing protein [Bacteroidaceae bacterium]
MNRNYKLWQNVCFLLLTVLVLSSCEKKSERDWLHRDYLAVKMSKGDSWSIIDKNGKEIVKEEYPANARISEIYEGVFWVKQDNAYQLYSINNPKMPVIDEEFAHVTNFEAGYAAVANTNQQIRIINTKGKNVATLPKSIKRCYHFSQWGYAAVVNTEDKKGIIDTKGNMVIQPIYDALEISNHFFVVCKDISVKKIQLLAWNGKELWGNSGMSHLTHRKRQLHRIGNCLP